MPFEERDTQLEILRRTPRRLEELVRGLPRAVVLWTPAPGEWSVHEIAWYLCDAETAVFQENVRRIAGGTSPRLVAIDAEALACEGDYRRRPVSGALSQWRRRRRETLAFLEALAPAAWDLAGESAHGAVSLLELVRRQAVDVDRARLRQIEAICERHAILERLAAAPRHLKRLLQALPEAARRRRPEAGRWSILENVCHLADVERLMLESYHRIAHGERPALRVLDADALAARRRYAERDAATELRELERLRALSLELLHALAGSAWQRRGLHPRRGEVTLAELVAHHLDHDAAHLGRVRALGAAAAAPVQSELVSPPPA